MAVEEARVTVLRTQCSAVYSPVTGCWILVLNPQGVESGRHAHVSVELSQVMHTSVTFTVYSCQCSWGFSSLKQNQLPGGRLATRSRAPPRPPTIHLWFIFLPRLLLKKKKKKQEPPRRKDEQHTPPKTKKNVNRIYSTVNTPKSLNFTTVEMQIVRTCNRPLVSRPIDRRGSWVFRGKTRSAQRKPTCYMYLVDIQPPMPASGSKHTFLPWKVARFTSTSEHPDFVDLSPVNKCL